ncbi:hypothetical protein MKX03_037828 [Papaver bracteatum]|nr:hypothetical protein MKX03_037828 [Papaver bracteatum]
MAYVHQPSLPEQSKLDGPKDIHKMSRRKRMLKQRMRKYLEEESRAKENDVHHTSVKDLHGNDVHIGNFSSCSEGDNTRVESLEVGSTSASAQQRVVEFVVVDNFKIPKEYEILYKKIHGKYGHIATKKVIKSSDTVLMACVSDLLRIISAMETKRGVELSEELLKEWEGIIKDAEALKFNVNWFREGFDRLKSQWMSDDDEQVLDAMQAEYVGLCTRKDELETDLSEVKIQIKKAAAKISSKREAIHEKQTQKFIFQNEPVLSILLN